MSKYTEFKVSSGLTVQIRPRSYAEWEKQEDQRLELISSLPAVMEAGKMQAAELLVQKQYRQVRTERLVIWVKDFLQHKDSLTMRDIKEIETAAEALEAVEIPLGNSDAGGSTQ